MSYAGFGSTQLRFDMFDLHTSANEARRRVKLAHLYHRGQELAWDGREVLRSLLDKHGGIRLAEDKRPHMAKIFGIIMWGELAAWKISLQLADQIVPLEGKMAATSQAHDEARHFYVMYDYLSELGEVPKTLDRSSRVVLDLVLETESLAEKLLGMQLMVETLALTIFQAVRESRIEPVLAELLKYYEKDEARHVGLGVQMLPSMIRRMNKREALSLFLFQLKIIGWSIAGLKAMEPAFRELGIDPRAILGMGRAKQVLAFQEIWDQLGINADPPKSREYVVRTVNAVSELLFRGNAALLGRGAFGALLEGWRKDLNANLPFTSLDPTDAPQQVHIVH